MIILNKEINIKEIYKCSNIIIIYENVIIYYKYKKKKKMIS